MRRWRELFLRKDRGRCHINIDFTGQKFVKLFQGYPRVMSLYERML
jgi:hypothetical protein